MAADYGITQLNIAFDFNGTPRIIHPTLIWDEENVILVDAGFPGQLSLFRQELERVGMSINRLNRIIVTHQDRDHIGGLAEIANAAGKDVRILAHAREKPFIQGDELFVKSVHRTNPPPPIPPFDRVKVTGELADGDVLPFAGGVVVIHTPGHSPGHICLYHEKSKTLVSGDALNLVEDQLTGPNSQFTHDLIAATASLKKLSRFDIQTVICYHGGVFRGDVNRRIAELAEG
jgi:glyoxylase-like metal-dependent hydrolase (beta-lactamase superfamily II)